MRDILGLLVVENMTKICTKCGIEKDVGEFRIFFLKSRNKYYQRNQCTKCESIQKKEIYKKYYKKKVKKIKPIKPIECVTSKVCIKCGIEKGVDNFRRFRQRNKTYYRSDCYSCYAEYMREWYWKNHGRVMEKRQSPVSKEEKSRRGREQYYKKKYGDNYDLSQIKLIKKVKNCNQCGIERMKYDFLHGGKICRECRFKNKAKRKEIILEKKENKDYWKKYYSENKERLLKQQNKNFFRLNINGVRYSFNRKKLSDEANRAIENLIKARNIKTEIKPNIDIGLNRQEYQRKYRENNKESVGRYQRTWREKQKQSA